MRIDPSPTKMLTASPGEKPEPNTVYCWPSLTGSGVTQHFSLSVRWKGFEVSQQDSLRTRSDIS